jgi:hypothetical protein
MPPRVVTAIVLLDRTTSVREERMMEWAWFSDAEPVKDANDEALAVQSWRAEQLRRLGVSRTLARRFAALVDWHDVAALVAHGCEPDLALDIAR